MSVGRALRFRVLFRDGFACRYCGRKPPETNVEVDHIVPRSAGGTDDQSNLVTACFDCNRGKRDQQGVLPPIDTSPRERPAYPIGLFFNVDYTVRALTGEPWTDWHVSDIANQGYVLGVQGDDVWVQLFGSAGEESEIRVLPRREWAGWSFYRTDREMRIAFADWGYRKGLWPFGEVERAVAGDDLPPGRALPDQRGFG